ncbi:Uroporphyrinogen-III synthase [Ceratobasidium theobromae]|uniref:Uroporphyrinogen-III synthase n=1 Tax=Ceratobasidium theobromae TaxID=1582974 RepID=A0A5N5QXE7_9AGAM|nr:Uroporphyrinogen-III synthase [Ceratobasidium theobromae]
MYTDLDRLTSIIIGQGEEYGGVIITSGRAVDAWCTVAIEDPPQVTRSWKSIPFYVVGPKTTKQLTDLQNEARWSDWLPAPDLILGAEAGTGEALAKFICTDYPARSSYGSGLRLLYLTGDKNAGGVEGGLENSGIGLHLVQVYATSASMTFENDFERAVKEGEGADFIAVFFAPSSAELALPVIGKHFIIRSLGTTGGTEQKPFIKIATIGPTTARALADKHNIKVDVVSKKPEPIALTEAILSLST